MRASKYQGVAVGLLLLVFGFSRAAESRGVYVDTTLGLGMGTSKIPTDTGTSLVGLTTLGLTYGITFFRDHLIIGGTSDYRWITQYDNTPTQVGNRRGSYFNLFSPTLGLHFGRLLLKFDMKLFGTYSLLNPSSSGMVVAYQGASGFRGEIYRVSKGSPFFALGLFFETTTFKDRYLNGTLTNTGNNTGPLTLMQGGLVMSIVLDQKGRDDLVQRFGPKKAGNN